MQRWLSIVTANLALNCLSLKTMYFYLSYIKKVGCQISRIKASVRILVLSLRGGDWYVTIHAIQYFSFTFETKIEYNVVVGQIIKHESVSFTSVQDANQYIFEFHKCHEWTLYHVGPRVLVMEISYRSLRVKRQPIKKHSWSL